jgi:RecQ family ATP-dependent DNA helicase
LSSVRQISSQDIETCAGDLAVRKRDLREPFISRGSAAGMSRQMLLPTTSSRVDAEIARVQNEIKALDRSISAQQQQRSALSANLDALLAAKEKSDMDEISSRIEGEREWSDAQGFPWSKTLNIMLRECFRLHTFRPGQLEAINCVLSGNDVFLVMAAGAGKSLVYQLPSLVACRMASGRSKITLIISPLVALMKDQVDELLRLGLPAASITKNTTKELKAEIFNDIASPDGRIRLLYISPEMFAASKTLLSKLEAAHRIDKLQLCVVDEAHCCSAWGHNFRKDYLQLKMLKQQFERVPLLALTATASPRVVDDVKKILKMKGVVFRTKTDRPNLVYSVVKKAEGTKALDQIAMIISEHFNGSSGIVYCMSQNETEKVSRGLVERGLRSLPYHAGMEDVERNATQNDWFSGRAQVIVATVSFGMGISKLDVRFVIHFAPPKSIDNYYQESGRAGRDGRPAHCILLFRPVEIGRVAAMCHDEGTQVATAAFHELLHYCLLTPASGVCRHAFMKQSLMQDLSDASSARRPPPLNTSENACDGTCDLCCWRAHEQFLFEMPWERRDGTRRVAKDIMVNVRSLLPALHAELEGLCSRDKHHRSTMMDLADALKKNGACKSEWDKAAVHTICVAAQAANIIQVTTGHTGYSANCYFKSSRNPPPSADLWVGLPDFAAPPVAAARSATGVGVSKAGCKRSKREPSFEDIGDVIFEVSSDSISSDTDHPSPPPTNLSARARGAAVGRVAAAPRNVAVQGARQTSSASHVLCVESDDEDDAPLVEGPAARAAGGSARRMPLVAATKSKDEFSISDDDDFDY